MRTDCVRPIARGLWLQTPILLALSLLTGCASSPFHMPHGTALRSPQSPMASRYQELNTRASGLDADNQNLHALLAQQQQQTAQLQAALQRSQQEVAQLRTQPAERQPVARGGVSARSASFGGALPVVNIPGTDVVPDGDVVRIRMDGSQLFAPGRAELRPEVAGTLDKIARALQADYSGHMVGIEGHTDNDPITKSKWKNNHELAVARSVALFTALKSRGVPENRLFVAGYGPNRPLGPNDSKQGKSQNRRVEIVVYPDAA